jgi:hypothetical protein
MPGVGLIVPLKGKGGFPVYKVDSHNVNNDSVVSTAMKKYTLLC